MSRVRNYICPRCPRRWQKIGFLGLLALGCWRSGVGARLPQTKPWGTPLRHGARPRRRRRRSLSLSKNSSPIIDLPVRIRNGSATDPRIRTTAARAIENSDSAAPRLRGDFAARHTPRRATHPRAATRPFGGVPHALAPGPLRHGLARARSCIFGPFSENQYFHAPIAPHFQHRQQTRRPTLSGFIQSTALF